MTERERLIEILCNAPLGGEIFEEKFYKSVIIKIADYLLENGVTVLPCTVGDNIYKIQTVAGKRRIVQYIITTIIQITEYDWVLKYAKYGEGKRWYQCNINDIGNTVFVTYAEAEKALKERKKQ